jgi:hypothetical protein
MQPLLPPWAWPLAYAGACCLHAVQPALLALAFNAAEYALGLRRIWLGSLVLSTRMRVLSGCRRPAAVGLASAPAGRRPEGQCGLAALP